MLQPNSWAHPIISLKTHIRIGPIYTPTIKPQDPKNTLTQSELCKTFILVELNKSIKARKQGNTQKMQFIDSPVIKLPVRNSLISLQQDNRLMHLGTSVWPCSLVLIKFIDRWAPPTTNDKPLLPTAWSRARAKPDSDNLLRLSTKYLSFRNLPKCRHCAIQARESDPNQSSTANKVLSGGGSKGLEGA